MNYLNILEYIRQPDQEFAQLTPPDSAIYYDRVTDSTIPKVGHMPWLTVKPHEFSLVEPVGIKRDKFRLHLKAGSCTVTAEELNSMYKGYADVYRMLADRVGDDVLTTEVAAVGWLQYYHLHHSVITPASTHNKWLLYDKERFIQRGASANRRLLAQNTLLKLYPGSENDLQHIRLLDLAAQLAPEVLERYCVYHNGCAQPPNVTLASIPDILIE